ISGFFGSGKSSFAKILGYLLENPSLEDGRTATDRFFSIHELPTVRAILNTIHTQAPSRAVFLDLSQSTNVLNEAEAVVLPVYRALLDALGYSRDLSLAELEYTLEGRGQLGAFEEAFGQVTGGARSWLESRHVILAKNEASHALHLLEPKTYPSSDSWAKSASMPDVNENWFAKRAVELLARRGEGATRLVFVVDEDSPVGLASQIYEEIRGGTLGGRLSPGDRLPASRELATTLGVSRHTVTTAYGHLAAEGFLDGRRGGGTVVSDMFAFREPDAESAPVLDLPRPKSAQEVVLDLQPGTPDRRLFPTREWKRHARWAVDRHEAGYGDPAGMADLRLVLARWIAKSRGVDASFRQLIVTSGAQQAFYLLIAACTSPGDLVAVEDPGYHRFRSVVEARGARVSPVPVDDEGIVVEAIPFGASVVYVTPSHQFPTGVTMSMSRRLALLELAEDHDMLVIEDDYDTEFRYVDRPLEPLYRLDRTGQVAYVASFSKTLSPALRLGYVVVPPQLLADLVDLGARSSLPTRTISSSPETPTAMFPPIMKAIPPNISFSVMPG
ncbi:MAG: aminotransferase class I/II-fold pyridoxal phosphate-dependent enzyme, partial [Actinobacteria bacterium]|nr:aminotransferase class I/II-fold pyridoxal phosphate-dependent enzyme [Actinomycetota bacterium]